MATRSKTASESAATGVLEAPNGERERIFDPFRHWGYLEADLDPLGFLPRSVASQPADREANWPTRRAASIAAPWARSSCTSPIRSGAAGFRSAWKGPSRGRPANACSTCSSVPTCLSRCCSSAIWATNAFRSKASPPCSRWWMRFWTRPASAARWNLVMGMSHRGRLNVIVHVAKRPPEEVFAGFEDVDPRSVLGSGDVKYHMGATGEYVTRSGHENSYSPGFESQPPGGGGSGDRRPHPRQAGPRRRRTAARNICRCWCTATPHSPGRASWRRL